MTTTCCTHKALAEVHKAHRRELAAAERAAAVKDETTEILKAAVEAGIPIAQLVVETGIPRMTLLRRLGKAPTDWRKA
jgi:transcriptional regulator of acetoin/glycerol metabolism